VLFDEIAFAYFIGKYVDILALETGTVPIVSAHFSSYRPTTVRENNTSTNETRVTRYRPRWGETICPRRWQFDDGILFRRQSSHLRQSIDPKIASDLRPQSVSELVGQRINRFLMKRNFLDNILFKVCQLL